METECQALGETIVSLTDTARGVYLSRAMPSRRLDLKAVYLLRDNVRTLLATRKEDQVALATWCGHGKSWINKFLNMGREVQLHDLDKIASFFGIEAYQLFQPGISRLTERRISPDRRAGTDRRIGHQGRQLAALRVEHAKLPRLAYGTLTSRDAPADPEIQLIVTAAERDIAAVLARKQAAADRAGRADLPADHRRIRRPRTKTGG